MKLSCFSVLFAFVGSVFSAQLYHACPKHADNRRCTFKGDTIARCKGLPYIPPLPKTITTLDIKCSLFSILTRGTFRNISTNRITRLILEKNSFTIISENALVDFDELVALEISQERNLSGTLVQSILNNLNTTRIRTIALKSNGWSALPVDMFTGLKRTNELSISLNSNKFLHLNTSILQNLKAKRIKLSCADCGIQSIDVSGLRSVTKLDLKGNKLKEIPQFCGENNAGFAPNLVTLDISANTLSLIDSNSFECLWNLRKLLLDSNPITILKRNAFSYISQLETLSLSFTPRLKSLPSAAFASKTLKILRFRQCGFRFDRSNFYSPKLVFKDLPRLSDIDLSKNFLPKEDDNILKLFSHFNNLKNLQLSTTGLSRIPDGFFTSMPSLESINLIGNKIEEWTEGTFSDLKNLSTLLLNGNNIRVINSTSFPEYVLNSIKQIGISDNPFACTCELKWFLDLLHSKNFNQKLLGWSYRYVCASPKERKYLHLAKYYPSTKECYPLSVFNIILISVCSVIVTVFLIIVTTFQCQINIRNILYFLRSRMLIRKGYMPIPSGNDFKYHVFIVYCEDDRYWVHNTLLKKLEIDGIRVCVHHRDFTVGLSITDNISECMDDSWKIIVVVSNKFAKSEWCQWELDLVHERKRRSGNEALIIIMYKEVDSSHMTRSLRTLLVTTPFIIYKKGVGEKLFWTTVIKSINKPLNLPPVSIL